MQSIEKKIAAKIYRHGRGWAFSKVDFIDLGAPSAIRVSLHRLCEKGTIRRVLRGIYDYPRWSKLLDEVMPPDLRKIVEALARKFGWSIHPSGPTALNLMGVSTQVPGIVFYQSSGPDRRYRVGRREIQFKKTPLKEATFDLAESALIVQGLKSLGRDGVTEEVIEGIRRWLPSRLRAKVLKDTRRVSDWLRERIETICRDGGGDV